MRCGAVLDSSFMEIQWFTRGWTLQELIAPQVVEFYNSDWCGIGIKESLVDVLSASTLIDQSALQGDPLSGYSIAKRMSWAAHRETTRIEDQAYSLMGLFDVNMPLLYGEGSKAFIRLQEDIMKISDDNSIMAWTTKERNEYHGPLATSPFDFRHCSHICRTTDLWNRVPYSVTNMGLSIELRLLPWTIDIYLAALDCGSSSHNQDRIAIFLTLLPHKRHMVRVVVDGKSSMLFPDKRMPETRYKHVYIRSIQIPRRRAWSGKNFYGFYLRQPPPLRDELADASATSDELISHNGCQWEEGEWILTIPDGSNGKAGEIHNRHRIIELLELGFDFDFRPTITFRLEGLESETITFDQSSGLTKQYERFTLSVQRDSHLKELPGESVWVVDVRESSDAAHSRRVKAHYLKRRERYGVKVCAKCGNVHQHSQYTSP